MNKLNNSNGTSNCKAGQENYEVFETRGSDRTWRELVQYDYRTPDGKLFSCVTKTLEDCRTKRDEWLDKKSKGGKA